MTSDNLSQDEPREGGLLGGTLLVAGTAIGASVLGLPIATGIAGFFPSLVVYCVCWALMAGTGLLFLELALWLGKDANIVSMAGRVLGRSGRFVAWVLYLYLFYSLVVAYVTGSGLVIGDITDGAVPNWLGTLLFVLVFSPWIYIGVGAVDKTNFIMVMGLGISYVAFVILGTPHADFSLLSRADWSHLLIGLPIAITSFGYQGVIPSLTGYLQRNARRVRAAILIGSSLPLIAYIIWQALILGIVPLEGSHGLIQALARGTTAVQPLRYALETPWVHAVGEFFAFFALTSSFLGVTIGLRDFLADGLRLEKTARVRFWLCVLIFLPALLLSWSDPRLFLFALEYGGGLGVTLLLGLLPIILVWVGRYQLRLTGPYRLMGGRVMLSLLGIGFLVVLGAELLF